MWEHVIEFPGVKDVGGWQFLTLEAAETFRMKKVFG